MTEIHARWQIRRRVGRVHEEQRKPSFGEGRAVAVRAEYGAVIVVEEHDILSEPTTGGRSNVPENVGEVLSADPVEIDSEPADRFQMLAKRVGIRNPGDHLIGHSGEVSIENGVSSLRGDRRQQALPHVFARRWIDHRRDRRIGRSVLLRHPRRQARASAEKNDAVVSAAPRKK